MLTCPTSPEAGRLVAPSAPSPAPPSPLPATGPRALMDFDLLLGDRAHLERTCQDRDPPHHNQDEGPRSS